MTPAGARRLAIAICAALAVTIAVAFAPWPDDWDGLGFLASIQRFDLASFSPHPPGYPVYVGLLKLAALVTSTPIGAARLVGVASGVVTYCALHRILGSGAREAAAAALICLVPLVFRAFSGVGSEGPALAFAALAGAGLAESELTPRTRWVLVGVGIGLGLGVRLSWAPLYLSLLVVSPTALRLRAAGVAFVACLVWAVPLIAMTGGGASLGLLRTHLDGHMTVWGGTVVTEKVRLPFLIRDLFVDGFGGGSDLLGVVILMALSGAAMLLATRALPFRLLLTLALPYALWITLGQNLRAQPRHALPLVALLALLLARHASAQISRLPVLLFLLLAALVTTRTAEDGYARHTLPPPGVQLLEFLRADVAQNPPVSTAVFAGASGRFLDGTEWARSTHPAATLGDALLALSRLDVYPRRSVVTNEVTGLSEAGPPLATFCRPERLDRRLPCLKLYATDGKGSLAR